MNTTTRLQLLDAVRRADQADTAYAAAGRARTRAARATVNALTDISRREQQLATPSGRTDAQDGVDELDAARNLRRECERREQAAKTRQRRAFTAARTANRELAALYTPHAHGRATGGKSRSALAVGILSELAAMPLEMIRATDALVINSSGVRYPVTVVAMRR